MRTLRRISATVLLALALSISALAGEMTTGVASQQQSTSRAAAHGDGPAGFAGDVPTNLATEVLLSLLQSLLTLF